MLLSSYKQYLRYGGWHSLDRFLNMPQDMRSSTISLAHWRYDQVISQYQHKFGRENVLVLPFELFTGDFKEFMQRLRAFAGVKAAPHLPFGKIENASRQYVSSYYLRWLTCINRSNSSNADFPQLFGRHLGKLIDRGAKRVVDVLTPQKLERLLKERLERKIELRTTGYFEESNRITSEITGINLAALGYTT